MRGNAGILIRTVWVVAATDPLDRRIDLYRVDTDVGGAPLERTAHVVAGTRADDQNVVKRRLPAVAIQQVGKGVGGYGFLPADHGLVPEQVYDDDVIDRRIVDAIVRRPGFLRIQLPDYAHREMFRHQQQEWGDNSGRHRPPLPWGVAQQEINEANRRDREPPHRRQPPGAQVEQ